MREFARAVEEIEVRRETTNLSAADSDVGVENMGRRLNPLVGSAVEEITSTAGTSIGSWGFADDSVLTSNISILDDSVFSEGQNTFDVSNETESITTSWGSSAVFNSTDHMVASGMNGLEKRFEKALGTGQLNESVIKIVPVSSI